jgi:hypothetical protein
MVEKATSTEPMAKVGSTIKWTSGAGGTMLEKHGVMLAIVPPNVRAEDVLTKLGIVAGKSAVKGMSFSLFARYLVRVEKKASSAYYLPQVRVIDGDQRRAAEKANSARKITKKRNAS